MEVTMASDRSQTELTVHVINPGIVSSSFGVAVERCSHNVLLKTPFQTVLISPQWSAHFVLRFVTDHDSEKKRITCTGKTTFYSSLLPSEKVIQLDSNYHCQHSFIRTS